MVRVGVIAITIVREFRKVIVNLSHNTRVARIRNFLKHRNLTSYHRHSKVTRRKSDVCSMFWI